MLKRNILRSNERLVLAIKVSIIIAVWYFLIPDFSIESPIIGLFRMLLAKIGVPTLIIAYFQINRAYAK